MSKEVNNSNVSSTNSSTKKVLRNYNGEPLKPGEKLVPIIQDDLFIAENVTNPDSITYVGFNGKLIKAVLTAIPEESTREAFSQRNYSINETMNKYWSKDCISLDEAKDEYDLDLGSSPSTEDECLPPDAYYLLQDLIKPLLGKSPKHALAFLLKATGVDGKEFADKMKLGHDAANTVRKEAERILEEGIANYDVDNLKANKSKNEAYYLEAAYDILDRLMDLI